MSELRTSKKEMQWKPCPFCGGTDIRHTRHAGAGRYEHSGQDVFSMCCYNCGATFPNRYRLELLNEDWNRRASVETGAPQSKFDMAFEIMRQMEAEKMDTMQSSHFGYVLRVVPEGSPGSPSETFDLHKVGAILAEIVEMGTSTVEGQPNGFRWPWSWEAENALRLLGKRATDYFPTKVDDAAGRTYWDCDFDLANEARGAKKTNSPQSGD